MDDYKPREPIPLLALMEPIVPAYCGCHREKGHYLWVQGMRWMDGKDPNSRTLCKLDGGFAPQETSEQGKAWLHTHKVNGISYTVLSFWDYSIDGRPGSNATFFLPREKDSQYGYCFIEALTKCKEFFPEVFARFQYTVTLKRNV